MRHATTALAVLGLAAMGCGVPAGTDSGGPVAAAHSDEASPSQLKLCAAIRGNGHYVITHFASLARLIESYGIVDGVSGGSSGSVTTFLYESMLKNPALGTGEARAARVALLLKSVEGYALEVAETPEALAVKNLTTLFPKLKQEIQTRGIEGLLNTDAAQAASDLYDILSSSDVRSLVNPEILAMLKDPLLAPFNAREVYTAVTTLGAFSVDDNRLFFRSGAISFDDVAAKLGRVGDFYAGYGPADSAAMSAFLDACAEPSRGKFWEDVDASCKQQLGALVRGYRARLQTAQGSFGSRLDEHVGDYAPLATLLATSVLEGDAVTQYDAALARYRAGELPTGNIPFAPSFDSVRFGYWGNAQHLATVASNPRGYTDLKTAKFRALGAATWREVLSTSPAEPGLAHFKKMSDGRISAGGWSDLAPVLVLKNLGCERVVYVTRLGDESPFATKIAKYLGMSEADYGALYDLGQAASGFAQSVARADAVWCTDWNSFGDFQQSEMAAESYSAPLETRDTSWTGPYSRVVGSTGKPGCTPGVSGGGTYPN